MMELTVIHFRFKFGTWTKDTMSGYQIPEYEAWKLAHPRARVFSIDIHLKADKGFLFVKWSAPQ
jgi:hypothetical protein